MIDNLSFLNAKWTWPIVILAFVIWAVFIWKETHGRKKNRNLKIGIACIAVLCLIVIALKPIHEIKSDSFEAIIISDNYKKSSLDSLKKLYKNIRVYNYEVNESIFQDDPVPSSVYVLGNGISSFDLWQLENIQTTLISSDTPKGLMQLNYVQNDLQGNQSVISGLYNQPSSGNQLLLEGPGGIKLDSVKLNNDAQQEFQLVTTHKATGTFEYALVEEDSLGNKLSKEPLPFVISDRKLLKVLIINGFPSFETKYLKNYLAEMGHQLVVRSQLTRGKFKYEYFNSSSNLQTRLNRSNLQSFDLLIIDSRSLRNLSRSQLNDLKASVSEDGLGIFIQADDGFFTRSNSLSSFSFSRDQLNELRLANWPRVSISKQPFQFKEALLLEPIHEPKSMICSAFQRSGQGKIGASVFKNTYELVLNGHSEVYQHIWSNILSEMSKSEQQKMAWSSESFIAYQDQPFDFNLRTTIDQPKVKSTFGYQIPIRNHMDISGLWEGTTFPRAIGWHQILVEQDSSTVFNYFVTDTSKWKTMSAYKTNLENRRAFKKADLVSQEHTIQKPIHLLWFYMVFLLSMGYLWLEPKL